MKIRFLFLAAALPVAAVLYWFVANSRAATETPQYTVVRTEGAFELRDYPELRVASTPMKEGGMNDGFGQLFRFITGANEEKAKIAMTAPVLIDKTPGRETMNFIMPKDQTGVPRPSSESVALGALPASRLAVLRFSGRRSTENEKAALEKLSAWVKEQKLVVLGEPIFAYYDPPWTPISLRRNEAMLRVEKVE